MQFVNSSLRRKLSIFDGPEPFKVSKAIDLRRQSIEYVWTPDTSSWAAQGADQSCFVGPASANAGKGWIQDGVGGSPLSICDLKSEPFDPICLSLTVKTPQAHDKLAQLRHHAPDSEITMFLRALEFIHSETHFLEGSRKEVGGKGMALVGARENSDLALKV